MRARFRVLLAAGCIFLALVGVNGAPQQGANSFSEQNLVELLKMEVNTDTIVKLVQKFGISFQPDAPTLDRLKKDGADQILLDAIRSAKSSAQPKTPAPPSTQPKTSDTAPSQPNAPTTSTARPEVPPIPHPQPEIPATPPPQPKARPAAPARPKVSPNRHPQSMVAPIPHPQPEIPATPPSQPKSPTTPPAQPEVAPIPHPQPEIPATPPPQAKAPEPAPQRESAEMSEATRYLRLGQLKAQEKDFNGALLELAEADKLRPQWSEVFYQRGLVLAECHRYGDAVVEWRKYLAVAGAEADVKTVEGKIAEWEQQAESGDKIRRLKDEGTRNLKAFNAEGAIAAFQEVVKSQPSLENLLLLAEAFWMKRDYASLSKTAVQVLALDPKSAQAILYQGAVELGQRKPGNALSTIDQGIDLDPSSAFGYELSCDALRQKRDFKKARAQCERALQINPHSGFAHDRLGWILWEKKTYPEALVEIRKAIQVEPENSYWQSDLAYALVQRHDLPGALAAAREALRLDAKCPYSHDAMGMVLEAQGNVEQAIQEFNEAIKLGPLGHAEVQKHLKDAMRKSKTAQ